MISVFFRIPAVERLSMARFVIVILYARIASGIPGTRLSIISSVASGVISLGEKPVPPVVRISSAVPLSAISAILSDNIFLSSGRTSSDTTSYPFFSTISRIAGPLKSSRSPRYPVSLDVMIATLFILEKPPCRADNFFRYLPFCISIIHISFILPNKYFANCRAIRGYQK